MIFESARQEAGQSAIRAAGFVPLSDFETGRPMAEFKEGMASYRDIYRHRQPMIMIPFGTDSNVPDKNEATRLRSWFDGMSNENKHKTYVVFGNTDNSGNIRYNKGLSIERAEQVVDILRGVDNGLHAITYGLGPHFPAVNGDDKRVEIYLLDNTAR